MVGALAAVATQLQLQEPETSFHKGPSGRDIRVNFLLEIAVNQLHPAIKRAPSARGNGKSHKAFRRPRCEYDVHTGPYNRPRKKSQRQRRIMVVGTVNGSPSVGCDMNMFDIARQASATGSTGGSFASKCPANLLGVAGLTGTELL